MKNLLYVALGGAIGAVLRYTAGIWLKPDYHAAFPIHTFLINSAGCLCIGITFAYLQTLSNAVAISAFLITGILGGFTTFSSFTMESVYLFEQGLITRALSYVVFSNVSCLAAAWLGNYSAQWIWK
ncbi:MAG: fluoride efflux transporter CrcB [Bacteroidia bacterium]|nr:fluoride efflux transporter CrcB [Bacteroidia bacterium]